MEPERPIEKTLRAAAAKRRAEAGKLFSLHPVDRKALQAEVAKAYGSNSEPEKPPARGWAGLWPQIAWSFALVFGLAAAVTMMLPRGGSGPGPGSFSLAKNEAARSPADPAQTVEERMGSRSAARSFHDEQEADRVKMLAAGQDQEKELRAVAPGAAPALTLAPARPAELAAGGSKLGETQSFRSRYGLTPAAPPATTESSSALVTSANEPVSQRSMKAKDAAGVTGVNSSLPDSKVQVTNQLRTTLADSLSDKAMERADAAKHEVAANAVGAAAPAASAAATTSAALALQTPSTQAQQIESLAMRQKFVQTTTPAGTTTTGALAQSTPAILNNFDFQQTGSTIRITDQDGSVYLGRTQLPPAVNRRFAEHKAENGNVTATSAYFFNQNSPATLFTVSGTNVTSGQLITFQGQLLAPLTKSLNEAVEMKKSSPAPSSSLASDASVANALIISTNVQLSGTLKVGTNTAVEIHARPTQRTRK